MLFIFYEIFVSPKFFMLPLVFNLDGALVVTSASFSTAASVVVVVLAALEVERLLNEDAFLKRFPPKAFLVTTSGL